MVNWVPINRSCMTNIYKPFLVRQKMQYFQARYFQDHRGSSSANVQIKKWHITYHCLPVPARWSYLEMSRMWRWNNFTLSLFRGSFEITTRVIVRGKIFLNGLSHKISVNMCDRFETFEFCGKRDVYGILKSWFILKKLPLTLKIFIISYFKTNAGALKGEYSLIL